MILLVPFAVLEVCYCKNYQREIGSGGSPEGSDNLAEINSKDSLWIRIPKIFAKHPFLLSGAACLLCIVLTSSENLTFLGAAVPAAVFFLAGLAGAHYVGIKAYEKSRKSLTILLSIISGIFAVIFFQLLRISQKPQLVILCTGFASLAAAGIYLLCIKKLTAHRLIILLIVSGFLMRLAYIMTVSVHFKQHDIGSIDTMDGHLGYIAYYTYNMKLPDFDVRDVYQFYHPPLHHFLAAVWVRLQSLLMIDPDYYWENVQLLTLFYSSCCMILSYRLFRQLSLKGKGLCAAMAVICFNPTFFILSGSINNDILSITLVLGAFVNTLYWYKSRSFGRIMCIAACIGFAMMAKLSGWMAAPAVAFIFILVFFKDLDNFKKYLAQFAAFLGLCAPLGLWWEIRNNIAYDVPITYVMKLSEKSRQYIGNIPVLKRIFDFSPYQFADVADQFTLYDCPYNEFNPLIALFKTSAFDEMYTVGNYPQVAMWDKFLFWSVVIVGIIGFVSMIFTFFCDRKMSAVQKIFAGIIYLTYFIGYYAFCFGFPHVCTQNIRYAVPLIVIGAFFFGKGITLLGRKNNTAAYFGKIVLYTITVFYSVSSVVFYFITYMH